MVDETISTRKRHQMLREVVNHQEAMFRAIWETAPIAPSTTNPSTYKEMMLDPSIAYCMGFLNDAVVSAGWSIETRGRTKRQLAIAADLESNLQDIDMASALDDALDALWRGFAVQEIVWTYNNRHFHLDELNTITPDQITLNLDDHMRLLSVTSKPVGFHWQTLPITKLWFHVNGHSRTAPAGESLLDAAHRAWSSKNRLLQFWGMSIQRFGMTSLRAIVPANTPAERQTQILATLYQGRLDGVYLIPDDVTVEPMNPTQWANLTFEKAIDYQDAEIYKSLLFIAEIGGAAVGQNYVTGAGLSVQARGTAVRIQRISTALEDSFTRQVIAPLVAANYSQDPDLVPRLKIGKPDAGRIATLAVPLAELVAAGVVDRDVAADQIDMPEPIDQPQQGLSDHALIVRPTGSASPAGQVPK